MIDRDRLKRSRAASRKLATWSNAANEARAMGEIVTLHGHGSYLVAVAERALRAFRPDHEPGCLCEACVCAWEVAAADVESEARRFGVDPKRHRMHAREPR